MTRAQGLGWVGITLLVGLSVPAPGPADSRLYSQEVCTVRFEAQDGQETPQPVTECLHVDTGVFTTVTVFVGPQCPDFLPWLLLLRKSPHPMGLSRLHSRR